MAPHPLFPGRRNISHARVRRAARAPRRRGGGARGALYVCTVCRGLALYNTDYTRLRFINSILLYTLLAL